MTRFMTTIQPTSEGHACPAGRPAAPSVAGASAPVSGRTVPTGATKESSFPTTLTTVQAGGEDAAKEAQAVPARGRIGAAQRRRLAAALTERDHEVLARIAEHRFLSTHQIEGFCFPALPYQESAQDSAQASARAARRTVARLHRSRLILAAIPRRVGGVHGGATPGIWQLSAAGATIQAEAESGASIDQASGVSGHRKRFRPSDPSVRFLSHALATADAHLAVIRVARRLGGRCQVAVEQAAVRRFPSIGGGLVTLRPDLYATIQARDADGDYEDRWFIEVDTGTESLPTLLAKCQQYETYRASGIEHTRHEPGSPSMTTEAAETFPLVLWVMYGHRADARLAELRRRIEVSRLPRGLFQLATPDTLTSVLLGGGQS